MYGCVYRIMYIKLDLKLFFQATGMCSNELATKLSHVSQNTRIYELV